MTPSMLKTVFLVAIHWVLLFSGLATASNVNITIEDTSPYHVYPEGKSFDVRVKVDYSGRASVTCQWLDYRGRVLAKPVPLLSQKFVTLRSPATSTGYYGLVFKSDSADLIFPQRQAGETREYGFAILPERTVEQRVFTPSSQFGMVHVDLNDPYMPAWVKTAGWGVHLKWWKFEMEKRRSLKTIELPLISGEGWDSDDTQPVSQAFLDALKIKIGQYFQADPSVLYWEAGIEEVLGERYKQTYYWPNLEAKIKVFRQAADVVNPDIKLIYQTVGTKVKENGMTAFLKSGAARVFDIMSIHPYAWPDFKSPDTWMTSFLGNVRSEMQKFKRPMPIWFTEVGATHHGNPEGFFGYPKKGHKVTGLSRESAITYIVKMHVLALASGVEKIFWYNYKDRNSRREHAEDHFGLRDFWGYPKPVYAAYYQLQSALTNKIAATQQVVSNDIHVFRFNGVVEDVLVAWKYPATESSEVPLLTLETGLTEQKVARVVNSLGIPVGLSSLGVRVTGEPIYIFIKKPSNDTAKIIEKSL